MGMAFPIVHQLSLLLLFVVLPLLALAQTHNNITLGSFLLTSSDDTSLWKSSSSEFAFGFHRIENQDLFLLAIDPQGQVIWNSPIPNRVVAYAAMLDTGNFILADGSGNYEWESFNNPADTILPTQVLEIGRKLSSPLKESNYTKGRFQLHLRDGKLVLHPIGLPTENPYPAYYESNTSDGARVIFNETTGYINVVGRNGSIVTLRKGNIVSPRDYYYRATLHSDGVFAQYTYPKVPANDGSVAQSWSRVWSVPDNICSAISGELGGGACGFNSYCRLDSGLRPNCECLPGFSLSDPTNKFSDLQQNFE